VNAQPEVAELRKLWSVTTLISSGLPKGSALENWIARQSAERAYDRLPLLQQYHRDGDRAGAIEWLAKARWERTKKAMARGTDIHAIAEKIALGETPEVGDDVAPYVEQYRRFLEAWRPTFLMAEAPVYNLTWSYAGTCDGIMELHGRRFLFDYKTTEFPPDGERMRPPWPEAALQLAAYARAEVVGVLSEQRYAQGKRFYLFDPNLKHEPMPKVDGALVIVISPFDCTPYLARIEDDVWNAFLAVRQSAAWTLVGSKAALFAPLVARPAEPVTLTEGGSV
jgi:hypothetical protein